MKRSEFLKRTLAAPIAAVVGVAMVKKQQKGRRIGMFGWWETPQHKEEAVRILKSEKIVQEKITHRTEAWDGIQWEGIEERFEESMKNNPFLWGKFKLDERGIPKL